MGEWRYSFTILDLGIKWSSVVSFISRPLYPGGKIPGAHWIGGVVSPREGLDAVEKRIIYRPCPESNPGSTGRSPSLYRLSYQDYIRSVSCVTYSKHHQKENL
jgi:hypothetical protein